MPWRNGPEFFQFLVGLLAMLVATAAGAVAKIADDVKTGNRTKFWTKQLWLDVPAVFMMGIIGLSLAEYFELSRSVAGGLCTFLGWLGPRAVDVIVMARLDKMGGKK